MSKWYQLSGREHDVAVCTKVSLARNVKGYNFTVNLSPEEKKVLAQKTKQVLDDAIPGKFLWAKMSDMNYSEAISLAERNLVSPEFVSFAEGRTLALTPDETVSIMVCEEDHLKLQSLLPGLEPEKAYQLVNHLDTILDEALTFSFDEKMGYLTQCPTNIGTAMRVSVMLQLPGLRLSGRIHHLSNTVSKLGLVLNGAFGEGSNPTGSLYQLSNQVTLGISEEMALQNLQSFATSIMEQEREARKDLLSSLRFEDMLYRALGTLQSARVMTFKEFMEALSVVKIGIANGTIKGNMNQVNELLFTLQPATINASVGKDLDRQTRDAIRAERVRAVFAEDK